MLQSLQKLQQKPKPVLEFPLPEKAIDNAVKDYRKRLQTCVSASGGYLKHFM